jgi:hypothetical protein
MARLRAAVRAEIAQWAAEHTDKVLEEDDMAVDPVIGQAAEKHTPGATSALLRLAMEEERLAQIAPCDSPEHASATELIAQSVREALSDAMWGAWENAKIDARANVMAQSGAAQR